MHTVHNTRNFDHQPPRLDYISPTKREAPLQLPEKPRLSRNRYLNCTPPLPLDRTRRHQPWVTSAASKTRPLTVRMPSSTTKNLTDQPNGKQSTTTSASGTSTSGAADPRRTRTRTTSPRRPRAGPSARGIDASPGRKRHRKAARLQVPSGARQKSKARLACSPVFRLWSRGVRKGGRWTSGVEAI